MSAEAVDIYDAGARPLPRMPAGVVLPLQAEELSGPSRDFLNDVLSEYNRYPEDSALHQYVQSRMDLISDGKIPVIVVHSDEKNALATTDCVVVFDGVMKILEYEEELDGLLAHEAVHIREGHVEAISDTEGRIGRLGKTRLSEAEADLRATELMDSKGINPKGLASLLDKLEAIPDINTAVKKPRRSVPPSSRIPHIDAYLETAHGDFFEDDIHVGDIEHGSTQDRKLNFEESLWLVDSRNASNQLKPLDISRADYEGHDKDTDLISRYDQLPPSEQALLLARQRPASAVRKLGGGRPKRIMEVDEVESRFETLIKTQAPELPEPQVKAAAYHLTRANVPQPSGKLDATGIKDLTDSLSHPALEKLGINPAESELTGILNQELTAFLKNPDNSLEDYIALSGAIAEGKPALSQVRWEPVLNHLLTAELDQAAARNVGAYLSDTDAPIHKILLSLPPYEQESQGILINSIVIKEVETRRLETANAIKDPIQLFKYLGRYSFAIGKRRPLQLREPFGDEQGDPQRIPPEFLSWGTNARLYLKGDENAKPRDISAPYAFKTPDEDSDDEEPDYMPVMEGFGSVRQATEYSAGEGPRPTDVPAIYEAIDRALADQTTQKIINKLKAEKATDPDADLSYARDIYDWLLMNKHQKFEDRIKLAATFATKKELLWAFDNYFKGVLGSGEEEETETDLIKFIEDEEDYLHIRKDGLPSFRRLLAIVDKFQKITARIEASGMNQDIAITPEDLMACETFMRIAADSCLKAAGLNHYDQNYPEPAMDSKSAVIKLLTNIPIARLGGGNVNQMRYLNAREDWTYLVRNSFGEKGPQTVDDLLVLAALGMMAENVQVNLQVPAAAIKSAVEQLSFAEGCELVFETLAHQPPYVTSAAIEYLVEEKAESIEDFEALDQYMQESLDRLLSHTELAGKLAIADGLLIENYAQLRQTERMRGITHDQVKGLESTRLLKAMLESGLDDRALKEYMFERWWLRYRVGNSFEDISRFFKLEDLVMYQKPVPGRLAQRDYWLRGIPTSDRYKPLTGIMQEVYTAGGLAKYYALRKLLIGEKAGVLNSADGRASLLEAFSQSWLDLEGGGQAEATLQQILESLFQTGETEELYQRLNPIMMELTLRPPQHSAPWVPIIKAKAAAEIENFLKRDIIFAPETPAAAERDLQMLSLKIANLLAGGDKTARQIKPPEQLLLSWSKERHADYAKERFTPLGMAIITGKKLGALGVRMLQLAGQYFPLTPEEKDQIADVYDNMRGQSRIQAYRVLKREAQHSPAVAELLANTAAIKPRIGGGSLMTVYKIVKKDGSEEAVAIKNPNAEYHLEGVVRLMDKTLAHAAEQDPANTTYTFMQGMLTDSMQWILDELRDPDFAAKDAQFRAENDTRTGLFDKGRSRYEIAVPVSEPTNTTWVRRDEFIDGKNLTGLTISDEPTDISEGRINAEDYKSAISLLTRNYVHQLTRTGLAHSDIHPGNFRITADNRAVAVFDRHNLLRLSDAERDLCKQVILSVAGGSALTAVDTVADYLLKLPENSSFNGQKGELLAEIKEGLQSGTNSLVDTLVAIKRSNVKVPLKLSLIIKNMLSLEEISKTAGFSNIGEAFLMTATQDEVSNLLAQN